MQLGDEVEHRDERKGLVVAFSGVEVARVWFYKARTAYWCRCNELLVTIECELEKSREGL